MSEDTENTEVALTEDEADELEALQIRARALRIKFNPKISADALRQRIREKLAEDAEDEKEEEAPVAAKSAAQLRAEYRRERILDATKQIRIRVNCLNPEKANIEGEFFCVANELIGAHKKFIPFGEKTDNGYHVPNILYKELISRRFLQTKTSQNKQTGNIDVITSWVPEFAVEVLPPLTELELKQLANQQAAAAGMAV